MRGRVARVRLAGGARHWRGPFGALAVADRVANATDDSSDDGVNGNCNLIHRVAREVSLAVVTEFKTVGYLQFSRSGD